MKILQLNMHRSKTAHELLDQIVLEKDVDIVIISEQYLTPKNGVWLKDTTNTAAIWIPQHKTLTVKESGGGVGYVWLRVNNINIISCYLTPSDRVEDFRIKLNGIEDKIMDMVDTKLVVAGDFNGRATDWGSDRTDSRGRSILDMAARAGLFIANVGNSPTFRRPGCEGTMPDITLVSDKISNMLSHWEVLEDFTGSDHNYITFSLDELVPTNRPRNMINAEKWDMTRLNMDVFLHHIERMVNIDNEPLDARSIVLNTMQCIREACNASMRKIGFKSRKTAAYWWTNEIAQLRKTCLKCRRKYTRARRNGEATAEADALKCAKKNLKVAIRTSKKRKWEELRNDLNDNPWGLGYKIVMRKLGAQTPVPDLPEQVMHNIVHSLFPTHDDVEGWNRLPPTLPIPLFSGEELSVAVGSLRNQKAPGPDGIPAEILKIIADRHPILLLNMYNACLREGIFPETWKRQRLVLVTKGKGDPESPSAYRPLCMLDTAGKLLERLLKPRIQVSIENSGGLSKRQHGFRPKMSTIGAIEDVLNGVRSAQVGNHHSRKIVLLATLDVRNAFNSVRWADIIHALERRFNIPTYLTNMIKSYLKDRELIYSAAGRQHKMRLTSGAAQGSILGPELWNISYDEILNIDMPPDTYLVGYADDIAAVIPARDIEEVESKLNQVMLRTKAWLDSRGLKLATEKTELLIITKRHIPLNVEMRVLTERITTQNCIRYLGLRLDSRLNFTAQLNYAATKVSRIIASLSRLMANIGGPIQSKRRLIMTTIQSVLLYGCEIWAESLHSGCRRKILARMQRTAALRVSSAYRTVSQAAILAISKIIPIDLMAKERFEIWNLRKNNLEVNCHHIRQQTLQQWQDRWNNEEYGRWTARLIPDVITWIRSEHGETNYYMTQLLSGHGLFCKYLHRMGKISSPNCIYEDDCIDDAEHTFFECPKWEHQRSILQRNVNDENITADNITVIMMRNSESWNCVAVFVESVLRMKKRDLDAGQYMR